MARIDRKILINRDRAEQVNSGGVGILRDLQDLDYKEIAQVLGIPEGTVKSLISRGRAELARLLERNKREVM